MSHVLQLHDFITFKYWAYSIITSKGTYQPGAVFHAPVMIANNRSASAFLNSCVPSFIVAADPQAN